MNLARFARRLYAAALAAFAVLCVAHGATVSGLQEIPLTFAGHAAIAYATALALFVLAAGLVVERTAHRAALATAALFAIWLVAIHVPTVVAAPRSTLAWVRFFETFALAGAALVIAASAAPEVRRSAKLLAVGRLAFGLSLPAFAASHFLHAEFVANLIPAWIPFRLFFAWFTGAAHLAAGLAVIAGVHARLAMLLAGAMYGSWALILHVPRAADFSSRAESTSLFVAVALCASAWALAASYPRRAGLAFARAAAV